MKRILTICCILWAAAACSDDEVRPSTPIEPGVDLGVEDDLRDNRTDVSVEICEGCPAGTEDCDFDGLSNEEEAEFDSNPCEIDTDGDGLDDRSERSSGSNPNERDSDGDGLPDGQELEFGFDPTNPDSYGDGVLDGDRWVVRACDEPVSRSYQTVEGEFFTLALDETFESQRLETPDSSPQNRREVVTFEDASLEIFGFLVSDQAGDQQLEEKLRALSFDTVGVIERENLSGEFDTHSYASAKTRRIFLETTVPMSPAQLRDDLRVSLTDFESMTQTPTAATMHDFYVVFITIVRDDQGRELIMVVTAPESRFESEFGVRMAMEDMSNTTAFGFDQPARETRCQTRMGFDPKLRVDWLWLVDKRDSVQEPLSELRKVLPDLFDGTSPIIDMRLGIIEMNSKSEAELDRLEWYVDASSAQSALDSLPASEGYGLLAAQQASRHLRSDDAVESAQIRCSTMLATTFVSDRAPQSLTDISSDPDAPDRRARLAEYESFFREQTLASAAVPLRQECLAAGVEANRSTLGQEYADVALATGGTTLALCNLADQLSAELADRLIGGPASVEPYTIANVPIPQSIRVFKNGQELERSRENGFDYFASTNSIALFGAARPVAAEPCDGVYPDHYAYYFDTYEVR